MERRFLKTAVAPTELRGEGDARKIVGYASVFYDGTPETEYELWAGVVERIAPTAFDEALARPDDVVGLFNHRPDNLLARSSSGDLRLKVDKRGLAYEIDVDPTDPDHTRVVAKLERGNLTGSSFAFIATSETWTEDEAGQEVRTINSVRLYDVSPATYPAYDGTTADTRSVGIDGVREKRDCWAAERDAAAMSTPDQRVRRARAVAIGGARNDDDVV